MEKNTLKKLSFQAPVLTEYGTIRQITARRYQQQKWEAEIIDSSGFRRIIGKRRMDKFAGRAMPLRACPLMSYRGTRNWPPTWTKTSGGSLAGSFETQRGEIGILQQVFLSKIGPYNKCYLSIEFRRMIYVGTLLFDDAMFCRQLCEFLQNHIGKSIEEIGDLDLSSLL